MCSLSGTSWPPCPSSSRFTSTPWPHTSGAPWRRCRRSCRTQGPLGDVGLELDHPRLLRLAAFLHDIGKGHGGEHAKVGAKIAATFAKRMGMDAKTTDLLVGAVNHHLLLPLTRHET